MRTLIDSGYLREVAGILFVIIAVAFVLLARRRIWRDTVSPHIWFIVSVLSISFEYFILGPSSFIHFYDEADQFVPLLAAKSNGTMPGPFAPMIAGGSDSLNMILTGSQFISLEMLLLKVFPLWLAIGLHKTLLAIVGIGGTYLICRRIFGTPVSVAIFLGGMFATSHSYLTLSTLHHGLGYALIPLAMYVFAFHTGARRFPLFAVALAALIAISVSPSHSLPGLIIGTILAGVLAPEVRWRRLAAGILLTLTFVVLNWYPTMAGLSEYTLLSARLMRSINHDSGWQILLNPLMSAFNKIQVTVFISAFVGTGVLFWLDKTRGAKVAFVLFIALTGAGIFAALPWPDVGLKPLSRLNFTNMMYCMPALTAVTIAMLWQQMHDLRPSLARAIPILVVVPFAFQLGWIKSFNLASFLGVGGIANLQAIPNLAAPDWQPERGFRTVTVPYRIYPNVTAGYGLPTEDGYLNLLPLAKAKFWQKLGGTKSRIFRDNQLYAANLDDFIFRQLEKINLDSIADPNLLKLSGVRYIISYVPVVGKNLHRISGPPEERNLFADKIGFIDKARKGLDYALNPPPVHVYEMDGALPEMYFADGYHIVTNEPTATASNEANTERALSRIVNVQKKYSDYMPEVYGQGRIISYEANGEGYRAQVDTSKSTILVINTPHLSIWHACVGAQSVPTFSVNDIQFGLVIPSGKNDVRLIYAKWDYKRGFKPDNFGTC